MFEWIGSWEEVGLFVVEWGGLFHRNGVHCSDRAISNSSPETMAKIGNL
jgi:hypothetical protein